MNHFFSFLGKKQSIIHCLIFFKISKLLIHTSQPNIIKLNINESFKETKKQQNEFRSAVFSVLNNDFTEKETF